VTADTLCYFIYRCAQGVLSLGNFKSWEKYFCIFTINGLPSKRPV